MVLHWTSHNTPYPHLSGASLTSSALTCTTKHTTPTMSQNNQMAMELDEPMELKPVPVPGRWYEQEQVNNQVLEEQHDHKRRCVARPQIPQPPPFRPFQIRRMADRPRPQAHVMVNVQNARARRYTYEDMCAIVEVARDEVKGAYHRAGVDPMRDPHYIDQSWIHSVVSAYHHNHPLQ